MDYTLQQFGDMIKQKYPDYQSIDSNELAGKMIEKYPVYKKQIITTESKAIGSATQGFLPAIKKAVFGAPVPDLKEDEFDKSLTWSEKNMRAALTKNGMPIEEVNTMITEGRGKDESGEMGAPKQGIAERAYTGLLKGGEDSAEVATLRASARVREQRELESMPSDTFNQKADKVFKKLSFAGNELLAGGNIVAQPFLESLQAVIEPYIEPVVEEGKEQVDEFWDWLYGEEASDLTKEIATDKIGDVMTKYNELPQDVKENLDNTIGVADFLLLFGGGGKASKEVAGAGVDVAIRGGKTIAPIAEKGFAMAKPVVEEGARIVTEAFGKFRTALKSSKNVKGDILKGLDQRTIEIWEAEKLAKEFGVELPASSFATPLKAKGEQIVGEGLFGSKLKARAEKAVTDFDDSVTAIQRQAPTSGELGEDIVSSFAKTEALRKKAIKELYDTVEDMEKSLPINAKIKIEATQAKDIVSKLLDQKKTALKTGIGSSTDVEMLQGVLKGLGKNTDLKTLRQTLKEVGDLANFNSFNPTTDEKMYRRLYGSLKNDIDNAIKTQTPELGASLDAANKAFGEFETLRNRPFAKSVKKLGEAGDVDTLADKLTKTKVSTNEVEQIYETLGEETTEKIQRKIIADIIEKAKSPNGGFTPTGFSRQLKSIGDERLAALLSPKQIQVIRNIDKINQLIAKGTAMTHGSQTALIQQVTGAAKAVMAYGTGGASLGAEYGLSRFFNTKMGQMFLKGVDKKTMKILKAAQDSAK